MAGKNDGVQKVFENLTKDPLYGPPVPPQGTAAGGPPEQPESMIVRPNTRRQSEEYRRSQLPESLKEALNRPLSDRENKYLESLVGPYPEYVEILQAEYPSGYKGTRFRVVRPDNNKMFYGQGNTRSTRVQAMQWIPTEVSEVDGSVTGDIFVAFARPQEGKSGLFVYTEKSLDTWKSLRDSNSIGRSINALGDPLPQEDMGEEMYSKYRDLHRGVSLWIFDKSWRSIRNPNEVGEVDKKRTKKEREAAVSEALETEAGKALREMYEKTYGRKR